MKPEGEQLRAIRELHRNAECRYLDANGWQDASTGLGLVWTHPDLGTDEWGPIALPIDRAIQFQFERDVIEGTAATVKNVETTDGRVGVMPTAHGRVLVTMLREAATTAVTLADLLEHGLNAVLDHDTRQDTAHVPDTPTPATDTDRPLARDEVCACGHGGAYHLAVTRYGDGTRCHGGSSGNCKCTRRGCSAARGVRTDDMRELPEPDDRPPLADGDVCPDCGHASDWHLPTERYEDMARCFHTPDCKCTRRGTSLDEGTRDDFGNPIE